MFNSPHSKISIHALLAESDRHWQVGQNRLRQFLSTLSLRRATTHPISILVGVIISIHALLAESDRHCTTYLNCSRISIHALLAESDGIIDIVNNVINHFYPRSPCGERREPTALRTPHHRFLSTLSLRRATDATLHCLRVMRISIHALLAESDFRQRN